MSDYTNDIDNITECTYTWKPATREQMIDNLIYRLNHTSKIRFIKRLSLKSNIRYWINKL